MRADDGRVVPNFINPQALRGEPLTVYDHGHRTRAFCYVDDLVEGIIRLMDSEVDGPVNIGNPNEITIVEFARCVLRLRAARRCSAMWCPRTNEPVMIPSNAAPTSREPGSCWDGNRRYRFRRAWREPWRTSVNG